MSGPTSRKSADLASQLRRRALRELARREHDVYHELYNAILSGGGVTRYQAKGQALTQLRHRFPDAYAELYAWESATRQAGRDVPADIRTKAWQRANALLADLRQPAYRRLLAGFQAEGRSHTAAYVAAVTVLRNAEPDRFNELLANEIQMWMEEAKAEGKPL